MVAEKRKLTYSCSRCRTSKLKCDRKVPCIECLKRGIGHLCCKDERQPRAKSSKTNARSKTKAQEAPDVEETAQVVEDFVDDVARLPFLQSSNPGIDSKMIADIPNLYWEKEHTSENPGRVALIQEIVGALPEFELMHQLYGVFTTRCQAPLGNVFHTTTFLKDVEIFCQNLRSGSVAEKSARLSRIYKMEKLSCFLLALMLGLEFHPTMDIIGWSPTPLSIKVEELRYSGIHKTWKSLALQCLQGRMTLFCGSIASLQAVVILLLEGRERSLELDSLLAAAISGARRMGLHNLGDMKINISEAPPSAEYSSIEMSSNVRVEIGIRIWWALVVRDWSRGQSLGYYSVNSSQFNTRIPLHINDEDLLGTQQAENSQVLERPRTQFTMLSYTRYAIDIASLTRKSIDLKNSEEHRSSLEEQEKINSRQDLTKYYDKFLRDLPTHFNPESTMEIGSTDSLTAIPVHRWMLQQQIWSLFLHFHRGSVSSDSRDTCRLLAHNVITTCRQVKERCTVCGSLSLGMKQLFNAALFLLLDILFAVNPGDLQSPKVNFNRTISKDKIREALVLLKMDNTNEASRTDEDQICQSSTKRSVLALEALQHLEEESHSHRKELIQIEAHQSLKELRSKVQDVLFQFSTEDISPGKSETLALVRSEANLAIFDAEDTCFEDLDLLPIASNDPDCDFWQFLNIDTDQSF